MMPAPDENPVLLKLSGKAFSPALGFDGEHLNSLGGKLKNISERRRCGLGIVTGAGNIYRGRDALDVGEIDGDFVGMTATITNGRMLAAKLTAIGVGNVVISAFNPITCEPIDIDYEWAVRQMENGLLVIFVGGTGSPGVTTDTAAAKHAAGCGMKTIWMAKDRANGVFDGDPNKDPNATHLPRVTVSEILDRKLNVMDVEALEIARDAGITHLVFNGDPSNRWHAFVTGREQVEHSVIPPF
jgi:uridylate kinase